VQGLLGLPAPSDVRNFLYGYPDIGAVAAGQKTITLSGTLSPGSAIVTGINTTQLDALMQVTGTGIATSPLSTFVLAIGVVDPVAGTLTLTQPATGTGVQQLTFTFNAVLTDEWLANVLSGEILPNVQRWTRQQFNAITTVTEYYDGNGSSILALRRRPVVQLLNISYTNVDSNLYYLTPSAVVMIADEGIIKAKANFNESTYTPIFWKGQRNIRIQYQVGYANCPVDVATAMMYLMAEVALGHIADQTGGGNASFQGYSRDGGKRGLYTNIRNSLARRAHSLLRQYMTGAAG